MKRSKAKKEKTKALQKAQRAINNAVRKAQKELHRKGINARRAERERKKKVSEIEGKGESVPIEMYEVIRDPEKNPTSEELEALKPHPSLIEALDALQENTAVIDPRLMEDDIEFRLERMEEAITAISDDEDSEQEDILSDNDDDSIASFDSITRNADFVSLGF
jgi:hypothetical protein